MAQKRRSGLSHEKQRLKYFLWFMIRKYQPRCYFCNEEFIYEDILPPRGTDNITYHHKDGDHDNSDPENGVLGHRRCHKSHHAKDNINKNKYDSELGGRHDSTGTDG